MDLLNVDIMSGRRMQWVTATTCGRRGALLWQPLWVSTCVGVQALHGATMMGCAANPLPLLARLQWQRCGAHCTSITRPWHPCCVHCAECARPGGLCFWEPLWWHALLPHTACVGQTAAASPEQDGSWFGLWLSKVLCVVSLAVCIAFIQLVEGRGLLHLSAGRRC